MQGNLRLLYGFTFFDQFMIVIPLMVPYLGTKGITMGQFMELQAIFAVVILCAEVPTGLLSDLWGRKRTLLLGSILKAVSFSLLPLWSGYDGFLVYHLTMGIALAMISGGDVALLYDSHLKAGGGAAGGAAVLGNAALAEQAGAAASALTAGAMMMLSCEHLVWANAVLSWIPVLLVLRVAEPNAGADAAKPGAGALKETLSHVLVRDVASRLVFLNLIVWGVIGLVMVWTHQKYWEEADVPLATFGVLYAAYNLVGGLSGNSAAALATRYGRGPVLAAAGVLPIVACGAMVALFGWAGIVFGVLLRVGSGVSNVLLRQALNERIASTFRATVMSLASLGTRGAFAIAGPLVGYGIDAWGLANVLPALALMFALVFLALMLPLVLKQAALARTPPAARPGEG